MPKVETSANALIFTGAISRQSLIAAWSVAQERIPEDNNGLKPQLQLNLQRLWRPDIDQPATYLARNDKGIVSVVPVVLSYRTNSADEIVVIAYAAEDAVMEGKFIVQNPINYVESDIELVRGSRLEMVLNLCSGSGFVTGFTDPDGNALELALPDEEMGDFSEPPCPRSCLEIIDEDAILGRNPDPTV